MTSSISAVELINALKCLKANNLANQKEGFLCFVVLATANASAILRLLSLQNLATSVLRPVKENTLSLLRYSSGRRNFRGRPT
jgi:hypothetical protein